VRIPKKKLVANSPMGSFSCLSEKKIKMIMINPGSRESDNNPISISIFNLIYVRKLIE
jgi:hypothetical protein